MEIAYLRDYGCAYRPIKLAGLEHLPNLAVEDVEHMLGAFI